MSNKGLYSVCVDFDGVLHEYKTAWVAPEFIPDAPLPGALEWLESLTKRLNVIIFSTRCTPDGVIAIKKWMENWGLQPTVINQLQFVWKPPALVYIDDRAHRFEYGLYPTAQAIFDMKPWGKKVNPVVPVPGTYESVIAIEGQVDDEGNVFSSLAIKKIATTRGVDLRIRPDGKLEAYTRLTVTP